MKRKCRSQVFVVMFFVLAVMVSVSFAGQRASDFGKQWVRSHPLTVTGRIDDIATQYEMDLIMGSGFSVAQSGFPSTVDFSSKNDFPWHAWLQGDDEWGNISFASDLLYSYDPNNQNTGWLNFDEPDDTTVMAWVGERAMALRELTPNAIIYTGGHSKGTQTTAQWNTYLSNLIDIAKSDVLMSNTSYPFKSNGTTDTNKFFENLTGVRDVALTKGVPYWMWIQTYKDSGHRLPSESDVRMSVFSLLTGGYTGISCYRYHAGSADKALLEDDLFTESALYAPFSTAAGEAINLGQALRFMESDDLRFVPGTGHTTPTGLTDWVAGAGGDVNILSISIGSTGDDKDGLIGFFTDDNGDECFMLTNLYHGSGLSAASTSLSFTVQFDTGVTQLLRINRTTGAEETVPLTGNALTITLPGGTGDLFKYDTGSFVLDKELVYEKWDASPGSMKMQVDQDEVNSWDEIGTPGGDPPYERANWVGDDVTLGGSARYLRKIETTVATQGWAVSTFDAVLRLYNNDGVGGLPGTLFYETVLPDLSMGTGFSMLDLSFDIDVADGVILPESFTVAIGFDSVVPTSGGIGAAISSATGTTVGTTDWGLYTDWDDEDGGSPNGWQGLIDTSYNFNLRIYADLHSPAACGQAGADYMDGDISSSEDGIPDCTVDTFDLSAFVSQWLNCTDPTNASCDQYWTDAVDESLQKKLVYELMEPVGTFRMMVDQDEPNSWDETTVAAYERLNWVADDIDLFNSTNRKLAQVVVTVGSQPWGISHFDGVMRIYSVNGTTGLPETVLFETTTSSNWFINSSWAVGSMYAREIIFSGLEDEQFELPETFMIAFAFTDVYGATTGSNSGGLGIAVASNVTTTVGATDWGMFTYWDDEDGGTPNGWEATADVADTYQWRSLRVQIWAEPYPDACGDTGTVRLAADISGPDGQPDCSVDLYDFAKLAADWLDCNDPAGCL